ncbi:MAG: CDP-diacylglycerol--serine O-phosphatidyltransferase [Candidatus Dadabacteria bacterium]|nr:MAG: CDP-diacylglycerol--serine O-phosphatidyltransferase [Candidatus Dadabacteria bacterium]
MKKPGKLLKLELRSEIYRRRFLVPNLVTIGSLFCGFLAIIYGSSDRFFKGVVAIGLAILLDGLDGRVARRLNATSKFGVEFDSFSDFVSFGIAPAVLMYYWCFKLPADEFGVFVCFLYVLAAATRLIRFNLDQNTLYSFKGLPSPAAAGLLAAIINFYPHQTNSLLTAGVSSAITLSAAFLMIAPLEYYSIKGLKIGKIPVQGIILLGALIALTWYSAKIGFLLLAVSYSFSAPFLLLYKRFFKKGKTQEANKKISS